MLLGARGETAPCATSLKLFPRKARRPFDCNIKTNPTPVILCNLILRDRFAIHKVNT